MSIVGSSSSFFSSVFGFSTTATFAFFFLSPEATGSPRSASFF
jgi:hypothetical protein